MRRVNYGLAILSFVALLSGCYPESENPLSSLDPKSNDVRLLGTWIGNAPPQPDGVTWIHCSKLRDGRIEALLLTPTPSRGNEVTSYRLHTTTVGSNSFMNLKMDVPDNFQTSDSKKRVSSMPYMFVKYTIVGETLRVWVITNDTPIKAAVEVGELKGKVTPCETMNPTRIQLSDTPENLLRFLTATNHGELFGPFLMCKKVHDLPPKSD